jgi:predicted DsbA family dithiol-disulfide isomerase
VLIRIVADMGAAAVTIFTDPYCPWSWAAEPHLRRLEVEFGGQVRPSFVIVAPEPAAACALPSRAAPPRRLALDWKVSARTVPGGELGVH